MNIYEGLKEAYYFLPIVLSFAAYLLYRLVKKLIIRIAQKQALTQGFDETRLIYVRKTISLVLTLVLITILGIIWDLSFEGLSVYLASFITIVGVGLFATWSMVSNITASIILFFFFPVKIGSKIKIVDGDNSQEGTVISISLFSIKIKKENGKDVYYPNNLAVQKAIEHVVEA